MSVHLVHHSSTEKKESNLPLAWINVNIIGRLFDLKPDSIVCLNQQDQSVNVCDFVPGEEYRIVGDSIARIISQPDATQVGSEEPEEIESQKVHDESESSSSDSDVDESESETAPKKQKTHSAVKEGSLQASVLSVMTSSLCHVRDLLRKLDERGLRSPSSTSADNRRSSIKTTCEALAKKGLVIKQGPMYALSSTKDQQSPPSSPSSLSSTSSSPSDPDDHKSSDDDLGTYEDYRKAPKSNTISDSILRVITTQPLRYTEILNEIDKQGNVLHLTQTIRTRIIQGAIKERSGTFHQKQMPTSLSEGILIR
eukprot:TRINITY_DN7134_c0_g1_i1.p1 TRINITY_DN7134_c0_g1~~TRINITY_DN7134_c0_g1_i1.p1  ORF type:complete len:311 (-),score=56.39 TRINITY_DN7134_c0_g1_i1:371-1303(-)